MDEMSETIKKVEKMPKGTVADLIDDLYDRNPGHPEKTKRRIPLLEGGQITMATMTLIKAINDAMRVEMERDETWLCWGKMWG